MCPLSTWTGHSRQQAHASMGVAGVRQQDSAATATAGRCGTHWRESHVQDRCAIVRPLASKGTRVGRRQSWCIFRRALGRCRAGLVCHSTFWASIFCWVVLIGTENFPPHTMHSLFFRVHARILSGTLTRAIPCRSKDITCRFGQQAVAATVVSIDSCVCVSPPFQRNGSVSVEVSFDGGQVRDYE